MSKFSNSRVASIIHHDTGKPKDIMYSHGLAINLHRCLNCGMDGIDHLNDGSCGSLPGRTRGIHIVTIVDIEGAFFDYFRRKSLSALSRIGRDGLNEV